MLYLATLPYVMCLRGKAHAQTFTDATYSPKLFIKKQEQDLPLTNSASAGQFELQMGFRIV